MAAAEELHLGCFSMQPAYLTESLKRVKETKQVELKAWQRKKEEYLSLKLRLDSLSRSLSYEAMVPFGKVGLIPGKIIKTNEVSVLLGQNLFVQRSTFQAVQIIDRRLEHIEKKMDRLKADLEACDNQISLLGQSATDQMTMEIKEDFDAEIEREWRDKHRIRVSLEKKKESEAAELGTRNTEHANSLPPKVTPEDFAAVMSRLDELELLESKSCNAEPSEKRVRWAGEEEVESKIVSENPEFSCAPVSILKNRNSPHVTVSPPALSQSREKKLCSGSHQVFTGQICEREVKQVASPVVSLTKEHQERPMSKFQQRKK